jgi:hypothetical protein
MQCIIKAMTFTGFLVPYLKDEFPEARVRLDEWV